MPKTLPRPLGDGSDDAPSQQRHSPSAQISPQNDACPTAPPLVPPLALMLARPPTIIAMATCIKEERRWRLGVIFGCSGGGGGGGGGGNGNGGGGGGRAGRASHGGRGGERRDVPVWENNSWYNNAGSSLFFRSCCLFGGVSGISLKRMLIITTP